MLYSGKNGKEAGMAVPTPAQLYCTVYPPIGARREVTSSGLNLQGWLLSFLDECQQRQ